MSGPRLSIAIAKALGERHRHKLTFIKSFEGMVILRGGDLLCAAALTRASFLELHW